MRAVKAQTTFLVWPLSRIKNTIPEIRLAAIKTKARAIIHFMRRIIPTLAAIALITLTVALGMWQMRRADYKTQLAQARDEASQTTPQELRDILADDGSLRLETALQKKRAEALPYGIRARLTGQWLHEHSVYIDNRTLKGIAGFHVVTPFALADSRVVVAVNRGWVARNIQDRNRLPAVATVKESVSFEAWIEKPQKAMELGGDQSSASKVIGSHAGNGDNTALWQNFDARRLEERAKVRLAPWLLRQSNQVPFQDGLNRDWPAPANDVAKHQGYAFQWFGLAALTAVLWFWFVIIKPNRRKPTNRENES
jgi:surfeit locus 1 family protein